MVTVRQQLYCNITYTSSCLAMHFTKHILLFPCFNFIFIPFVCMKKKTPSSILLPSLSTLELHHSSCFDLIDSIGFAFRIPYRTLLYIMFYTRIMRRIFIRLFTIIQNNKCAFVFISIFSSCTASSFRDSNGCTIMVSKYWFLDLVIGEGTTQFTKPKHSTRKVLQRLELVGKRQMVSSDSIYLQSNKHDMTYKTQNSTSLKLLGPNFL